MSFIEIVQRAGELLRQQGRISLRALKLEFHLDEEQLEALVEELVDVQQVAAREGRALAWRGSPGPAASPTAPAGTKPSAALDAERRQLTVMFVDLVGSTELSRRLDAEELRALVRRYQEAAADVIEHFEGHVAQYLGDGLLVYFGWPKAHEDDAERAVRAGLAVVDAVEALRASLAVRVGIHTGPVVVGEMGGGQSRETLAMGETTNVAARIQGAAAPGAVVLSSATLRLVSGIFATQDLGERVLRGAGAAHLHRALRPSGMRSRLDVTAATGLTPLVGRGQELGLLEDRFAQMAEGLGQAVLISGEAGIGKSRLVQAFRERIAERGHSWLECRCSPYTQDSAFYPVLELQRQALGLGAEAAPAQRVARLGAGLERAGFDLAQAMPLMAGFHGLPLPERFDELELSPEGRRKQTLELLVEWLLRLARLQPMVFLIEDLHWVDPSTQELIGRILERVPREPVLLLATYRPDFEAPWGAKSHLTPMLLSRLTRPQLGDLVRKAARDRDLPAEWVEEIVRRSDGVPLFAEELTRTVLESHPERPEEGVVPELQIPESLQDSLMARLDALGPVKELAQLGSVLGREFDYPLLLAVSPMKEAELQQALSVALREELFYQRGTPPEASYLFKHALIRDAAYDSLLRVTRQRHHRRVADTLIERMPQVSADRPELVAHHLTEGSHAAQAIEWWRRAGEAANARVAHEEAIRHLRRGLSLVDRLPDDQTRDQAELGLQLPLGHALTATRGWAHPDTLPAWERARELCFAAGDPARSGLIYFGLSLGYTSAGRLEESLDLAGRLLELAERCGDPLLEIAGHRVAGSPLLFMGRLTESCEHLEQAIARYEPEEHDFAAGGYHEDSGIAAFGWLGWVLWHLGFPDRARGVVDTGLELARRFGRPYTGAYFLTGLGGPPLVLRGDWQKSKQFASDGAAIADSQGFMQAHAMAGILESWATGLGDGDPEAVDRCTASMARMATAGNRAGVPLLVGMLAHLQLRTGRVADALGAAEMGVRLAAQLDQHLWDAELRRLRGECFLRLEDHTEQEAEALFREAITIAQGQDAKSLELRAATSLARLWRDQDKRSEACGLLQPVYDWFTEGFDTQDLQDAKALLEVLG